MTRIDSYSGSWKHLAKSSSKPRQLGVANKSPKIRIPGAEKGIGAGALYPALTGTSLSVRMSGSGKVRSVCPMCGCEHVFVVVSVLCGI